jgi:effector-binding domain-containing protein
MINEPRIESRQAQPYVGIRSSVTMGPDFTQAIDRILPELQQWLVAHDRAGQGGPPVFRYLKIDMQTQLDIEFCIPLSAPIEGDERVAAGEFPAGRYAVLLHTGPYDGLMDATRQLLEWGEREHVRWQVDGDVWRARLETYLTDPAQEPDASKWETEIRILVAN